jgi:hypothetical protein
MAQPTPKPKLTLTLKLMKSCSPARLTSSRCSSVATKIAENTAMLARRCSHARRCTL